MLSHFVNNKLFPGGLGVNVFFVISGFLITRLLFAEYKQNEGIDLRNFYARRALRLYPVIIVYTVFAVGLSYVVGRRINLTEPASALFYFANYYYSYLDLIGQRGGTMPFAIFWSLSIEEHFYLIFPIILIVTTSNISKLISLLASVIVAVLIGRVVTAWLRPDLLDSYVFYYQTQFRVDSLAVGVLLAALCEVPSRGAMIRVLTRPWLAAGSLVAVIACLTLRDPWFRETIRYTVLSLAIMVLIVNVVFSERYRPINLVLNSRPMILMGRLSYSLYVWHLIVPDILSAMGVTGPKYVQAPAEIVMSFLVAAASYYGVEKPCLSFRHRFGSRASDPSPRLRVAKGG